MKKIRYAALTAISAFVLIQSCSKSSGNKPAGNTSFDRGAMLANMSANVIIPAYSAFQTAATNLDAAVTTFNTAPNAANLTSLQTVFKTAYLQWQSTSEFDFGPAAQINLRVNTNTYPADVTQINSNITSNTYVADLLSNIPAKGFPAIDYLLFGTGTDNNAILLQYTTDSQAANRKTYLAKLSAELKANAASVLTAWNNGYKTTFINASGTDQGSSTGLLLNQLVYDYEVLKNFEIGIPAGVESMGTIFPQKVQAYYSKISVQLALQHLQAVQNIYTGGSGSGFDDYLTSVAAKYNGGTLTAAISNQFSAANTKLQGLTDPLSANIINNTPSVTATYDQLESLTVLLKTDMPSSLGILITFGDTDGD